MSDEVKPRSMDNMVFGYEVYPETKAIYGNKPWFHYCDGRVGKEHDIKTAVNILLNTIRTSNTLAGGEGYLGDFDYMLGREMQERSDLLYSDKVKVENAIRNKLNDILPGLKNINKDYDLGLALSAYARISHDKGEPKPPAKTMMEKIRAKLKERITDKEVYTALINVGLDYVKEEEARRLNVDGDRRVVLDDTMKSIYKNAKEIGVDVALLQVQSEKKEELKLENSI